MWLLSADQPKVNSVEITPLDGVTASQTFATGAPAKWTSLGAPDLILQGAAVLSLKSTLRGPKYRNRIYLPWTGEGSQVNGTLAAASVALATTAWTNFFAAMTTALYPPTVVSPTDQTESPMTSFIIRPYVRTQRRRVRR